MFPRERGEDRPCLGFGEVVDGLAGLSRGLERPGRLAERDEGDVLLGGVGQERLDGAQAQRDGLRRVVPLLGHPGQPCFEVLAVEVVEADVLAFDVLGLGEVAEEAFQADPVGLDRLRRQCPDRGHVDVQVVPGEAEEVRGAGCGVASHPNPTSGSSDWLCLGDVGVGVHEVGRGVDVVVGAVEGRVAHVTGQVGQHRGDVLALPAIHRSMQA